MALLLSSWPLALAGVRLDGTVVNARTGAPVAGVLVSASLTSAPVFTDRSGAFSLSLPDSGHTTLHIRHIGFGPVDLHLALPEDARHPLSIALAETAFPLDPVVTTATRAAAGAAAVSAAVEVIPAGDIRLRTAVDAGELLASVPGVITRAYGSLADMRTLSIRGSTAGQVLILLDGERLNTAQLGEVDLSILSADQVERIEVVRGGASAQYGADAVGGVVNIITNEGTAMEGSRAAVQGTVGSFGTRGFGVNGGYATPLAELSASYRFLESDGTFPYQTQQGTEETRRNADARSHALSARALLHLNEQGGELRVTGRFYDQGSGDPGMLGFPLAGARKQNSVLLTSLALEQPFEHHLLRLQGFMHRFQFGYNDPQGTPPIATESWNTAWGGEAQESFGPAPWLRLTSGYTLRLDRLSGNSVGLGHQRTSHGLYLQAAFSPSPDDGALTVSALPALRFDSFSDFGGSLSPKLGVLVSFGADPAIALKVNGGLSYRAPTFNDLYWPRDNFSVGNPLLRPERAADFDAGLHLRTSLGPGAQAGLTWFQNDIRDLILWQPGLGGVWRPDNIGRAFLRGLEAELWVGPLFRAAQLGWTYTWLDAEDRSGRPNVDGMQLPYQPEHTHRLIARITGGRFRLDAELIYMSRRYTTGANTTYLPAYHATDLSVGYAWTVPPGTLETLLAVRNLENEQYQMVANYPLPGRELRLTVNFSVTGW
ncbi:MAG TPA: TonB-dependent receptor [Chloroflexota bacterium]